MEAQVSLAVALTKVIRKQRHIFASLVALCDHSIKAYPRWEVLLLKSRITRQGTTSDYLYEVDVL